MLSKGLKLFSEEEQQLAQEQPAWVLVKVPNSPAVKYPPPFHA